MPSQVMDQRRISSLCVPSVSSSFFSEEIRFPAQRKVGFWKPELLPGSLGSERMAVMSGSKSTVSSPLEKLCSASINSAHNIDAYRTHLFKDQKSRLHIERSMGPDVKGSLSMSQKAAGNFSDQQRIMLVQNASLGGKQNGVGLNGFPYENGLLSSSLPEIVSEKSTNDARFDQSAAMLNLNTEEEEPFGSLKEIEARTIGDLLPDDDELLSDVIFERENVAPRNGLDDVEDDLFYNVGGLELESGVASNGPRSEANSSFGGHPYGEHPSRTLFVRNVNSNVEDSDLRRLFEQYGDIRTLYTACKHRGFAMISYYDMRSAYTAMRALQNKLFMHEKLDVHFSIPKENSASKDTNEGTLMVLNFDLSVSNDDLHRIFSVYGEIKEISETPHKQHHKFIEFYDVRAAEAAHFALNMSDFAGNQIMLEGGRLGDTKCLMQQLSHELEQQEASGCQLKYSPNSSPSLHYGMMPFRSLTSNGLDHGAVQSNCSAPRGQTNLLMENGSNGLSPTVPHYLSSPIKVASLGNHTNQSGTDDLHNSVSQMCFGFRKIPSFHPHSLPEYHDVLSNSIPCNTPNTMSSLALNVAGLAEGIDKMHISAVNSAGLCSQSFVNHELALGTSGNSSGSQGYQYILNNSNSHHHLPPSPYMWSNSPSLMNSISPHSPSQLHGFSRASSNMLNTGVHLHHHHVGSAPTGNPSLWERRHAYERDFKKTIAFQPSSLENMGFSNSSTLHPLEFASHMFPHVGGNFLEPSVSSPLVGLTSPQQRCHMFHGGRNSMIPSPVDRVRGRRSDTSPNQLDNKKQYELDVERIIRGEDNRTTLMIKNIPNKYTSKMLLAAIDENYRGTYDFIYLPIDFKNKCNVGYAFINIIDPQQIVPFYKAFNGKRWEKFNSEKVASLAYARIQGKAALIAHFQNSSLMNEDKRCRPILFHSDGPNAGDQEPFPVGANIRSRSGRPRTQNNGDSNQGSPSDSSNGEEISHDSHSSSDSMES